MKAEKKITIKVKSKAGRRTMADPEVEMISEWNIKRILAAVLVLFIFIIIPAYYFTHSADNKAVKSLKNSRQKNESNIKQQDSINEILPEETVSLTSSKDMTTENPSILSSSDKPIQQTDNEINTGIVATKQVEQQRTYKNTSETEYLNPNISLARLAQGVNKTKPYGKVDLPLLVDDTKARGVFFFTEVSNMLGSTVFHEWLKEGKSIYKLKAVIRSNQSRFYTSKLFTHRSVGQWQVRIITDQGEVLHKIDFSVENK